MNSDWFDRWMERLVISMLTGGVTLVWMIILYLAFDMAGLVNT